MVMGFTINPRAEGASPELIRRAAGVSPATIGHLLDSGFLDPAIKPLFSGVKVAGPAFTVRIAAQDSTAVHKAMGLVQPGDVVVIDRLGDTRHACVGEVVALAAKTRGVAAIVIDGVATDAAEIRELGIPVFSRGLSPLTTKLLGLSGEINVPVQVGGVVVRPGDLVVADDNGVLVLDPALAPDAIAHAEESERLEVELKRRVVAGEPLPQITGADKLMEANIPSVINRSRK